MRRLLVTGASGTLGQHVARLALAAGWEVTGTFFTAPRPAPIAWRRLDVTDRAAVAALVAELRPDAIIHTAYQARGPALWAATADGAANVALAAARAGVRLVHLSTDALFDGTAAPYDERARPSPITPYGAAKAAAETAVAAIAPGAAIVRTSLILSHDPLDPQQQLVLALLDGQPGRLFTDEVRCPIAAEDLAAALLELVADDFAGVINVAGPEALSRYALGRLVAAAHGRSPEAVPAGTLAASGLHRPADVRLDLTLAGTRLATRPRAASAYLRPAGTA